MQVLFEAGAVSEYQLDGVRAASSAADAQLVAAQAQYSQAASMAENSYVNSPFSGVVGRVWAREGNMAGGGPLLSIANASTIRASVLLPERYLGQVHVGQPARVELASTRVNYPGVVTAASNSVDPVSGMIAATVEFDNTTGDLFPGQSGRVAIGTAVSENALSLPEIALRRVSGGEALEYAVAVESDGVVSIIPVEVGIRNNGFVEIVSGLSSGDRVLVAGQHLVSDGERVEVQ
jgi:HlyD family secretion protein